MAVIFVGKNHGFSLLELLIAVVLVSVLASTATMIYKRHQVKVARMGVQAEIVNLGKQLQEYKMINKTYSGVLLFNSTDGTVNFPTNASKPSYVIKVVLPTPQTYTITATPINSTSQAGDGVVCYNYKNQRFWRLGATSCALSDTSTWFVIK